MLNKLLLGLFRTVVYLAPLGIERTWKRRMVADLAERLADPSNRSLPFAGLITLRSFIDLFSETVRRGARRSSRAWKSTPKPARSRANPMDLLWQDVRLALRSIRRNPGSAGVVIGTLALGVGVNSAVFSVLNEAVLRPWPYPEVDRIVRIWETKALSKQSFERIRDGVSALSAVSGYSSERTSLTGDGEPTELTGGKVTESHFRVMGVMPAMGRPFSEEESRPGQSGVAILSHGFWDQRLGREPDVLGRSISLDGQLRTVVGVMPAGYRPLDPEWSYWVPLTIDPTDNSDYVANAGTFVLGRLRDGASLQQGEAELSAVATGLAEEEPGLYTPAVLSRATLVPIQIAGTGPIRTTLRLLLGAAVLVLLTACANVSNLLLMKGSIRGQGTALRMALGASRSQVVRLHLVESLVLSAGGGLAGLGLAKLSLSVFRSWGNGWLPGHEPRLDGTVLLFTFGASVAAALVAGIAPALRAMRTDLRTTINERSVPVSGQGRRVGLDVFFMVVEVAFAVMLVVGTGLLLKSSWMLHSVEPGFQADNVLTLRVNPPTSSYGTAEEVLQYYRGLEERLLALPEIESVGSISFLPMTSSHMATLYWPPEEPPAEGGPRNYADFQFASANYFESLKIPFLAGRGFERTDDRDSPPIGIINEAFAQAVFGEDDPIGREIVMFGGYTFEVIGVVGDVLEQSLERAPAPEAYFPLGQTPQIGSLFLTLRTQGDPIDAIAMARSTIWSVDSNVPIEDIAPMTEVIRGTTETTRTTATIFTLFGGLALVLGLIGVYGVFSGVVQGRMREIGIRMALGADGGTVLRETITRALPPVGAGLLLGVLGAILGGRFLEARLFGVAPTDTFVIIGVAGLVALAAFVAVVVPARRAASVDPAMCLVPND